MKCRRYEAKDNVLWNRFIAEAKNGHFMFDRRFMEYHSNRFEDHSIIFENNKGHIIGVLPANICENKLISHQGLTFGGLIMGKSVRLHDVMEMFDKLCKHISNTTACAKIVYKRGPDLYSLSPAQEDLYALHTQNAKLIGRLVTSSVEFANRKKFNSSRLGGIKKAKDAGVMVSKTNQLSSFWKLLGDVLRKNHQAEPVHSIEQITLLAQRFPDQINCYVGKLEKKIVSGAVVFETPTVVKTQYLAVNEYGRKIGALDLVIDQLFELYAKEKKFIDFGTSFVETTSKLNYGLLRQKEGFGAQAFVQDIYEILI